jgi:hypothetical protein
LLAGRQTDSQITSLLAMFVVLCVFSSSDNSGSRRGPAEVNITTDNSFVSDPCSDAFLDELFTSCRSATPDDWSGYSAEVPCYFDEWSCHTKFTGSEKPWTSECEGYGLVCGLTIQRLPGNYTCENVCVKDGDKPVIAALAVLFTLAAIAIIVLVVLICFGCCAGCAKFASTPSSPPTSGPSVVGAPLAHPTRGPAVIP